MLSRRNRNEIFAAIEPQTVAGACHHQGPRPFQVGIFGGRCGENFIAREIENVHLPVVAKTETICPDIKIGIVDSDR